MLPLLVYIITICYFVTGKNDEGVYNCIKEKQGGFPHPGVLGINKFNVTSK